MKKIGNKELDIFEDYNSLIESCSRNYRLSVLLCEKLNENCDILRDMCEAENFDLIKTRLIVMSLYRGLIKNISTLQEEHKVSAEQIEKIINDLIDPGEIKNLEVVVKACALELENIGQAVLAYCFFNVKSRGLLINYIESLKKQYKSEETRE